MMNLQTYVLTGKYGLNVGPMIISWSFRFANGKVEAMIGRAMAEALNRQKRREREELKRIRKDERAKEKEAKRVAREFAKMAKKERRANLNYYADSDDGSDSESSYCGMTASNVIKTMAPFSGFDSRKDPTASASNFGDID
jgi:hypothetical protein